jgi:hypothetical protein
LKPVKPGSISFYLESDGERGDHDAIATFAHDVRFPNSVLDEDYGSGEELSLFTSHGSFFYVWYMCVLVCAVKNLPLPPHFLDFFLLLFYTMNYFFSCIFHASSPPPPSSPPSLISSSSSLMLSEILKNGDLSVYRGGGDPPLPLSSSRITRRK